MFFSDPISVLWQIVSIKISLGLLFLPTLAIWIGATICPSKRVGMITAFLYSASTLISYLYFFDITFDAVELIDLFVMGFQVLYSALLVWIYSSTEVEVQ